MKIRFVFALAVLVGISPSLASASDVNIPEHPPVPIARPVLKTDADAAKADASAEQDKQTKPAGDKPDIEAAADDPFANAPIPPRREDAVTADEQLEQQPATAATAPLIPDNTIASTVPPELQASPDRQASIETHQKKAAPAQRSTDRTPAAQTPADEAACRAELAKISVKFTEAEPQSSAAGCSMPHAVAVSSLGSEVEIKPAVVVNCQTALAAAKFVSTTINPAALGEFKSKVKSIAQASGYVCRPRNGTSKLSEHAYGNALDIAAFTLENGTVVNVKPAPPADQQRFLRKVRDAACGPFKTVLGPGSNADHAEHLHFDLAPRRNGSTYCK